MSDPVDLGPASLFGAGYSAIAGLPFDDAELESRLVWLWSTPFAAADSLHRGICERLAPAVVPIRQSGIPAHLLPRIDVPIEIEGTYHPAALNMLRAPYPGYAFSDAFAESWRPELRRLVLTRLWASVEATDPARRDADPIPAVVLDESESSYALGSAMTLLPASRMVVVVGDPLDAAAAAVEASDAGGSEGREAVVESVAAEWCCVVDAALAMLGSREPARSRMLRADGQHADPAGTLAAWIGGEHGAALPPAAVSGATSPRARALGRRARRRVGEIVGDRLDAITSA